MFVNLGMNGWLTPVKSRGVTLLRFKYCTLVFRYYLGGCLALIFFERKVLLVGWKHFVEQSEFLRAGRGSYVPIRGVMVFGNFNPEEEIVHFKGQP